ncbi:PREDICTED: putative two-component response regulator-like APRR6 [Camelina sativa]|uniref:Two-component response regulator-like APRR6 n=1 Tax=Camelina sativa TaxID=90675 RepID=A0ABM0SSB5_CAMSA|nr:PREDICTED: putative two-component response regulator-like APRR6 [Camelina sativa]
MVGSVTPQNVDDIFVLLIEHDAASVASLTSMLEPFSKKVISMDAVSKALSIIEKQKKDIGLVLANIEMPQLDSHSFLTALLQKNIPLTLINPEKKTKKPSDLLTNRASFTLNKPISEIDIKNMWQYVLHKKSQELMKINMTEDQENVIDKDIDQIEAFRASLKRQRTSQASLLGRQHFISKFTTYEAYHKRKIITNVERESKPGCPIEVENKRKEWMKVDNSVGRRQSLWTNERHMKFLAAISILGEKEFRPKSILKIMNDPNLTHRQVASHLQKYKTQIERIRNILSINEWKPTKKTVEYPSDYEYPFKTSNLIKNLIASNSLWNSLRKKNSSSSSSPINPLLFKNPTVERKKNMSKFHRSKKLDLSNHSRLGNVFNKSSMNVASIPSTISSNPTLSIGNANHTSLVPTGLGSEIFHNLSDLPSNTCVYQTESARISIPHYDPNPLHPPKIVHEVDINHINLDFPSVPASFVPLEDLCNLDENYNLLPNSTMNSFETNIDQMSSNPFIENHSHHRINMNHIDWNPSTDNYVFPQTDMNITFPRNNTNQKESVSSKYGYVPPKIMIPSEVDINLMGIGYFGGNVLPQKEVGMNDVGLVYGEMPYEFPMKTNMTTLETNTNEGLDVSIENLISFDIGVEKNMAYWLEETSFSEGNNLLPSSYLTDNVAFRKPIDSTPNTSMENHDNFVAINIGSTSQQHNTMESCEYHNVEAVNQKDDIGGEDHLEDYRDCIDWIDQVMNKDV